MVCSLELKSLDGIKQGEKKNDDKEKNNRTSDRGARLCANNQNNSSEY